MAVLWEIAHFSRAEARSGAPCAGILAPTPCKITVAERSPVQLLPNRSACVAACALRDWPQTASALSADRGSATGRARCEPGSLPLSAEPVSETVAQPVLAPWLHRRCLPHTASAAGPS